MTYNRVVLVGRLIRPQALQLRGDYVVHLLPATTQARSDLAQLRIDCIALVDGALAVRDGIAFVLVENSEMLRRPRLNVKAIAKGPLTEKRTVKGHKRVLRSGKIIDVVSHERRIAKRKEA